MVVGCLQTLVKRSEPEMIKALTGKIKTALPLAEFLRGSHQVFQAFEKSHGEPVDVVEVQRTTDLGFHQFQVVVDALVGEKLLVDIDGERLGLYTPRQRHTYRMVKDEPVVVAALAERTR
jgi:hypothetical protein